MLPAMGGLLPGGDARWIGDRVVIAQTRGGDYGIETVTTLTVASALPPRALFAELLSPGPVLGLRATESDLWALSYAKGYEGDGPLPNERVLWRLDPTTAVPELQVLSSVPELQALASGARPQHDARESLCRTLDRIRRDRARGCAGSRRRTRSATTE
jgi:hypothetical protein